MFEHTKRLCEGFLRLGVPGFDLLVWQNGKEILRHSGGYNDLENKVPVRGDELYNIYSCSKPITVTSAMQLWEQGLFDLEEPLAKYMPEYQQMSVRTESGSVPAKNPILIRNLFTMTAGFSYDLHSPRLKQLRQDTDGRCPTREVARYLSQEPLYSEPGTEYRYSLCHDVLAALVEVISGEKFEDYTRKHIFEPMGMTKTDFLLAPECYTQVSPLYRFDHTAKQAILCSNWPTYRLGTEHASGGAGCVSTVEDYMKFLEGLRTFRLLKKETIEYMTRNWHNEQERKTFPLEHYHYGLGIRARNSNDTDYTDFGWGGAAGAVLNVDIPHGICIYYSQHLLDAPNKSLRTLVYSSVLKDLGFDVQVELPPEIFNTLTY